MTNRTPAPDATPGLPARQAALRMLDAVMRRGESLDTAQHAACQGIDERSDRALAMAIAGEVLRHLPGLDLMIDSMTRLPLADDAKARMVLRIMLAQTLVLETPPHATIATALPLLQGGPRKLAHGVFGSLMRAGVTLPAPELPPATAHRWQATWGDGMVEAAGVALGTPPPLDLALADSAGTDALAQELGGISLMPGHVRLQRGGAVELIPGFEAGGWWVQDISASLPARLLGTSRGGHVLDLCAAPGGKTMQLAAAGWNVTALDNSEKRLRRLRQNLKRTGLEAQTVTANLLEWRPDEQADAVLLDAPCSATGIFRRHPDVLYRIALRHIEERAEQQAVLLDRASNWVKPGGVLVYAVCSLEPEEGEAVIDQFLAADSRFAIDPVRADELPAGVAPDALGRVRTLPGMLAEAGGLDGFFMARLRRTA
ncbi:MAG: RsmB/NOP family class I SAM-dependent RNA methyltransferase [Blastomonas fulva]|uniref:RsmB/NOP family class I SAM-dependent RNA methyltransferase n=1 Tax=Blastomonas fulva TaxID=1550728 RepID=UPI004033A928